MSFFGLVIPFSLGHFLFNKKKCKIYILKYNKFTNYKYCCYNFN